MGIISYVKKAWDRTSKFNPTVMNNIENGIYNATVQSNLATLYGECSTTRDAVAKEVSVAGVTELKAGLRISVRFSDTGSSNPASGNLSLNVNGLGAKQIVESKSNKTVLTYSSAGYFYNNMVADFVFDGTYWVYLNRDTNSTYNNANLGNGYGTCSTAQATAAKAVTLSGYTLNVGGTVAVKFTYAVPANATMNVNSKGAKYIFFHGAKITADVIKAGDVATFIYDGTQYQLLSIDRWQTDITTINSNFANLTDLGSVVIGGIIFHFYKSVKMIYISANGTTSGAFNFSSWTHIATLTSDISLGDTQYFHLFSNGGVMIKGFISSSNKVYIYTSSNIATNNLIQDSASIMIV